VCDLRVSARLRDAESGVTVVLRTAAVVGGNRGAQILFWGLSTVGSPWHPGVCRMRGMFLCLGSGRPRQGLGGLFGPWMIN